MERIRLYFGITRMVPSLLFQHCQSQALKQHPTSFNQLQAINYNLEKLVMVEKVPTFILDGST